MLLYNLAFPKDSSVKELYYRSNGQVKVDNNTMEIQCGEVSFDTYFNSFSAGKYLEYTELKGVVFSLEVSGKGTVKIVGYNGIECAELNEKEFNCDDSTEVKIDILLNKEHEIIYPVIKTETKCSVSKPGYYSENNGNAVSPAIIICTFHREDYVYNNLNQFRCCGLDIPVFLVDNGKTIDKNNINYPHCRVFQNKNYGGSGGFTRGMIEVLRDGCFSHIVLMDDDVTVDCIAIQKTLAFIKYLKSDSGNIGIAGGMLERQNPCRQFEASAKWENGKLIHLNHNLDLTDKNSLIENEKDHGANYGAWWFLCMPIEVLNKGLPFPFFIKTDDIEYGLRTLNKIIVLNGIGLWHDSFDGKFNYYLEYYIKRNELVCNAIHEKHPQKLAFKKLFFALGKCLVSYNYECVKYITRAFDDYLKGTDFFLNIDEEQLNSRLREQSEKTVEIDGLQEIGEIKDKKLLRIITLNGYLMPSCFLKKENRIIHWAAGKPKDYFGYKNIIEFDFSSKRGMYRTMKKRWLFIGMGLLIKYSFKLAVRNARVAAEYKKEMSKITSIDFWCNHLEIQKF